MFSEELRSSCRPPCPQISFCQPLSVLSLTLMFLTFPGNFGSLQPMCAYCAVSARLWNNRHSMRFFFYGLNLAFCHRYWVPWTFLLPFVHLNEMFPTLLRHNGKKVSTKATDFTASEALIVIMNNQKNWKNHLH